MRRHNNWITPRLCMLTPAGFSKHILKKKCCFLFFLSTQQDSIYLPRADHNSLIGSFLLGKHLRMHSSAANCIHNTELLSISHPGCSSWIRNGPKQKNEGTSAWDRSVIIELGFHYLCLNFMLFKLFTGNRKQLWVHGKNKKNTFIIWGWIVPPSWPLKMFCWVFRLCGRELVSILLSFNSMNRRFAT